MLDIDIIAEVHYGWVEQMGWTGKKTILEGLALVASEVGEAVNECRGAEPTDKLPLELADIILRTFAICKEYGVDVEKAILDKMAINFEKGNFKNRAV